MEEDARFKKFTIKMMRAIYERQVLINCNKCNGKDEDCPQCYGFGAIPSLVFVLEKANGR